MIIVNTTLFFRHYYQFIITLSICFLQFKHSPAVLFLFTAFCKIYGIMQESKMVCAYTVISGHPHTSCRSQYSASRWTG